MPSEQRTRRVDAALLGIGLAVTVLVAAALWWGLRVTADARPARAAAPSLPAPAPHTTPRRTEPAGDNPFRVVSQVGGPEAAEQLEMDFSVREVDFSIRISGDVANDSPFQVVAEGQGFDAQAALDQALREAVSQGVGRLVSVEPLIQHRKQIELKVLSGSPKWVLQHKVLAEQVAGGRHRVRLQATIDRGELARALREAGVPLRAEDE